MTGVQTCALPISLGSRYSAVQALVNAILSGSKNTPSEPKKSVTDIAKEVIKGLWGNGTDRMKRLESAGYNYNEVQNKVNQMLSGNASAPSKSVDQLAREVIQGLWGNGADRKNRLTAAGYDYNAVQARVNQMMQ